MTPVTLVMPLPPLLEGAGARIVIGKATVVVADGWDVSAMGCVPTAVVARRSGVTEVAAALGCCCCCGCICGAAASGVARRVAGAARTGRVLGRICESEVGPALLGSIVMLDMERLLVGT
jgi:hypothetical protein